MYNTYLNNVILRHSFRKAKETINVIFRFKRVKRNRVRCNLELSFSDKVTIHTLTKYAKKSDKDKFDMIYGMKVAMTKVLSDEHIKNIIDKNQRRKIYTKFIERYGTDSLRIVNLKKDCVKGVDDNVNISSTVSEHLREIIRYNNEQLKLNK